MRIRTFTTKRLVPVVAALALVAGFATPSEAATLTSARKAASSSVPSAANNDTFTLGGLTAATNIGCITVTYDQGANGTTGAIPGFSVSGATSGSSAFWTGGATVTNDGSKTVAVARSNAAAVPSVTTGDLVINGLQNGSNTTGTTYYAVINTYSNTGCSTAVDNAVVGFVFTPTTQVSVIVDPTMTFNVTPGSARCSQQSSAAGFGYTNAVSATDVNLGRINASTVGQSSTNLEVITNAAGGANVTIRGDQQGNNRADSNLRDGSKVIEDRAQAPVVGTEGFSFTNSDTDFSNTAWKGLTNAPVAIAGSAVGGFSGECVGFSAAAGNNTGGTVTPAGSYRANVYYTAVPTF